MAVARPEEEDNLDRWAPTLPVGGTGSDKRGRRAAMLGNRGEAGPLRKMGRGGRPSGAEEGKRVAGVDQAGSAGPGRWSTREGRREGEGRASGPMSSDMDGRGAAIPIGCRASVGIGEGAAGQEARDFRSQREIINNSDISANRSGAVYQRSRN
ncbi:hypothetical protein E2562_001130 [Oryza meyeriana var. granulata]|uniref:Uncharacterized protein n=1 Tax=Oryza meyeriana var. granulata TaxID=110450 RepID=A0A6G1EDC3_9ORYZ|nr:hypothetical protein E2562_001130 [Oryza meyeriana var. granulata]